MRKRNFSIEMSLSSNIINPDRVRPLSSPQAKVLWPLVCCLALSGFASGACASAPDSQGEAPAALAGQDPALVDEVMVTARRLSESLSQLPASVSVFNQDSLDQKHIRSFEDLVLFTPGIDFDRESKTISIRGVHSNAGDATTGIYIDETPIQIRDIGFGSNNSLPIIFDLDRVEVLRGPQGTVFGAGSEGGTVRYITPQPSLSKFSLSGRSELAFTDQGSPSYEAGLALGGPIVADRLGFRLSLYQHFEGGYINRIDPYSGQTLKTDSNSKDSFSWRLAMTYKPFEQLTLTPSLQYQSQNQRDTDAYWPSVSDPSSAKFINANPDRAGDYDHFYLASLKIAYDLGNLDFISNSSGFNRREYTQNHAYEGTVYNLSFYGSFLNFVDKSGAMVPQDPNSHVCGIDIACNPNFVTPNGTAKYPTGSPLLTATGVNLPGYQALYGPYYAPNSITNVQQNFTQEFRIQTKDPQAKLNWVLGAFYQNNRQDSLEEIHDPSLASMTQYLWGEGIDAAFGFPGLLANGDDYYNRNLSHSSQLAAFADASYQLTDQWKISGGLRYAKTHFDVVTYAAGPQDFGIFQSPKSSKNETPVTPKIALSYQINRDDMVYGSVAKGYRVGGGNPILNEDLIKSCGPDLQQRNLATTPATYNSDSVISYEIGSKDRFWNRQVQISTSLYHLDWSNIQYKDLLSTCGLTYTANFGSVTSNGIDFEGSWQMTPSLRWDLALGYVDARFSKNGGANLTSPSVLKGDTTGGAPLTISLGATFDFEVQGQPAYLWVSDNYASKNPHFVPDEDPRSSSYDPNLRTPPAIQQVSFRLGTRYDRWDVSLHAENLFNAHPELSRADVTSTAPIVFATSLRPLTIGLTGLYHW